MSFSEASVFYAPVERAVVLLDVLYHQCVQPLSIVFVRGFYGEPRLKSLVDSSVGVYVRVVRLYRVRTTPVHEKADVCSTRQLFRVTNVRSFLVDILSYNVDALLLIQW